METEKRKKVRLFIYPTNRDLFVSRILDFSLQSSICFLSDRRGGAGALLKMEPRPDGRGHYMSIKTFFNIDSVPVREGHTYAFDVELRKGVRLGTECSVYFIDDVVPFRHGRQRAAARSNWLRPKVRAA